VSTGLLDEAHVVDHLMDRRETADADRSRPVRHLVADALRRELRPIRSRLCATFRRLQPSLDFQLLCSQSSKYGLVHLKSAFHVFAFGVATARTPGSSGEIPALAVFLRLFQD
jgi:hypothetical protein